MRRNALGLFVGIALTAMTATPSLAQTNCDLDFNNDGVYPSPDDAVTFFSVFAGASCANCDDIDINNDGAYPDQLDAILFLQHIAGDPCSGGPGPQPDRQFNQQPDSEVADLAGNVSVPVQTPDWIRWVAPWGSNSNPGTQAQPFATIQGALMRSNTTAHGIVYVMPGVYDMAIQWQYDSIYYGGESPERPLIIAAAPGSTTRPILNLPNTVSAGLRLINGTNYVEVRGLEIRGTPRHTALITAIGNAHDLIIDDCVLVGGTNGVSVQGLDGQIVRNVTVRRTIIKDQRNPETHAQGAYVSAGDNVVFEDCVFYNTGNRDTFSQGIYFVHGNYTRAARNNWFGDPGFAGIQARGGNFEITGNVFEDCGNAIGVGHPMSAPAGIWTAGTFSNNLIAQPKYPGWGIAIQRMNCANIFNNIFFSNSSEGQAFVRQDASPCGHVFNNEVRGWGETFRNFAGPIGSGENIEVPLSLSTQDRPAIDWNHLTSRPLGVWNNTYDARHYINFCRDLN